jgi:YVTN family beta-propeller protein
MDKGAVMDKRAVTNFTPFVLGCALLLAGCAAVSDRASSSARAAWPDLVVHLHGVQGKAYLVDPKSDAVVAELATAPGAALGSTTPDGKRVYVGSEAPKGDTVTVIDLDKRAVVAQVKTGSRPKHPLVSPDGKWVMVNHWGLDAGKLRVAFIDTRTNQVAKNIELDVSRDPGIASVTSMHNSWSWDSRFAYTVDRVDGHLVVIDTRNWSVQKIKTASAPHYPVPSPDGRELWLVVEGKDRAENRPGALVFDLTQPGMRQVARVDMPLIDQEVLEGHHGSFTQDGRQFLMLNRGPGSKMTGTEVVAFDAASKKLVARAQTRSTGIGHAYNTPDGRYAVITNYGNNVVSIIDARTLASVKDLEIGKGRMGHIAFTKDGRYGYLSNAGDGNLHKIDMNTLQLVREIRTGGAAGAGQVLNVWTNVFEELPR